MLIIADTSALIAIATCDGLDWLDTLFTEIQVPQAVFKEATEKDKPQADTLKAYLTGKVIDIDLSNFVIATQGLGLGELEAMALYKHQQADNLLIDDLRARKAATYNNIKIIGSIGVLLLAKEQELISAIKPYLELIQQSEIHIGKELIQQALTLANE